MSEKRNSEKPTAPASTASSCYVSPSPEPLDFGFYNMDCMEGMGKFPDKYFDLAIVDTPYGIKVGNMNLGEGGGLYRAPKTYKKGGWDDDAPDEFYFDELYRVSVNQIVWGANHFASRMRRDSRGWIFWDKNNWGSDFADGELAWTSFDKPLRKVPFTWSGFIQGDMKNKERRIHPTQKPIYVYRWILHNYARAGWKILDTHVGSGSSLIACEWEGFDYVGFEIDADYYAAAMKRIETWRKGRTIDIFKSET